MNSAVIKPCKKLSGTLDVPGDKSVSHRCLILASLADGTSRIENLLLGEDVLATMRILGLLGVSMSHTPESLKEGNVLYVKGCGLDSLRPCGEILDCGNSGTTMRLMLGLLSACPFESVLTGDASLNNRPMDRVIKPLAERGAHFKITEESGRRLIYVCGSKKLSGLDYRLPVASAQVKSALLLSGLAGGSKTILVEPAPSRDHTENMLSAMGADIKKDGNRIVLNPDSTLKPFYMKVPGDFSSAAFFIVGALIKPGSSIMIRSVGVNPTRRALADVLRRMGGFIKEDNKKIVSGEKTADLLVKASALSGAELKGDIIPALIDEIPIFSVAAACAKGRSVVCDAEELRVKESDRISSLSEELKKMGVSILEKKDGFEIEGGNPFREATFDSHGDHRIAMSLAIALLSCKKASIINDTDCVSTSFPGFFEKLSDLSK